MIEPCSPWVTGDDLVACPSCDVASSDPAVFDEAARTASAILFRLTGQKFTGGCERTIRPAPRDPCHHWRGPAPYGGWVSVWDPWRVGLWGCGGSPFLDLYGAPVREVTEVLIGGVVLDPASYRLDQGHVLTRMDGHNWPSCQNLALPTTEAGTFQVSYRWGADVPQAGIDAAIQLGCEVAKLCSGQDADCDLPANVQSVIRQGVSYTLAPQQDRVLTKPVGLDMVDLFIQVYGIHGSKKARRPTRITGPSSPIHRSVNP